MKSICFHIKCPVRSERGRHCNIRELGSSQTRSIFTPYFRYPMLLLGFVLLAGIFPTACADPGDYTISAMSQHGGSIAPSGNIEVQAGESLLFTIIPELGFQVSDVIVDGRSVGPVTTYLFSSVYGDHVVIARFHKLTGSILVTSSPPGATVYLDHDPFTAGITTEDGLGIEHVDVGNHAVVFVLDGYTTEKRTVSVRPGEQTVVPLVYLTHIEPPPTTEPTTAPTTTIPTTSVTTGMTTVPTTTPTTVPTTDVTTGETTIPTTSPTTAPTTEVTTGTTTAPTTAPTTIPTTVITTEATTVPTTEPTTVPTTEVTTEVTTVPATVPPTGVTTVPTTVPASPPPDGVTDLRGIPGGTTSIVWTWDDPADISFDHVMVFLGGLFQADVPKGIRSYTTSGLQPGTTYTLATRTVGMNGEANETWVNRTAETLPDAAPGAVWVYTTPSRAEIAIDGIPRGYTPDLILGVTPGIRNITVSHPGYRHRTISVQVTEGDLIVLEPIELEADNRATGSGKIWVYSVPSNARISVNGTEMGSSNRLLDNIPAGQANITLSRPGYRPKTILVDVPDAGLIVLEPINLEPV